MLVAAKSGVTLEQMRDRVRKGAKYVELHLFEKDIDSESKRVQIIKNIKESGLIVRVVHTPIDRKFKLEGCGTEEGFKIIEDTCRLANEISKVTNEMTCVVNHLELNLEQLKLFGLYDIILKRLKYLLDTYPNIKICLENETVIELFGGKFELKNSYGFEIVDVCKNLRDDIGAERVGLVLDTCHAISSIRLLQHLVDEGLREPVVLKDYFTSYGKYLDIIHFSNARGYGNGVNHGVGFESEDELQLLREMIDYIKEITFNGILTLEVQEEDYLDVKEFPKLLKQIKESI